jgi:hypothetical protein
MFTRTLVAIFCLNWLVVSSNADEPPKYKPIDAETIAAYKTLRGNYSEFDFDANGFLRFLRAQGVAAKGAGGERLPGFFLIPLRGGTLPKLPPVQVPFVLYFRGTALTDAGLKEIKDLKNLTALDLCQTQVTDAGLKELKDLKNLTALDLCDTKVTDEGLKELKDFKNLATLQLYNTRVTDLKELKELKNLTRLNLGGSRVTDEGLKELKGLKNLTFLILTATKVTNGAVGELQQALPKCKISRY